ncbi:hypothetical protein EV421DRAFT_2021756 [Armillaria borealis]|uniref:Uncharacterized protein n=1 Tax=Armillaria borealis TaxID=47425 RepID=A0AA39MK27_9AGAR|nr:hypothetical protein EV421DRAFT_2021756 [Armillaria borealis]
MVSLGLDASFVLHLILSCGILMNPDLGATSFAPEMTANNCLVILEEYTLFGKQAFALGAYASVIVLSYATILDLMPRLGNHHFHPEQLGLASRTMSTSPPYLGKASSSPIPLSLLSRLNKYLLILGAIRYYSNMPPLGLPLGMEPTDRNDVVNTTGSYALSYVPSGAHQPSVNIIYPTNRFGVSVSLGSLGTLQCMITRLLTPWAPRSRTGALSAGIKGIFSK